MVEHKQIYDLLKTLNIPVAYDHFNSDKDIMLLEQQIQKTNLILYQYVLKKWESMKQVFIYE